jgi:hypothetical protein
VIEVVSVDAVASVIAVVSGTEVVWEIRDCGVTARIPNGLVSPAETLSAIGTGASPFSRSAACNSRPNSSADAGRFAGSSDVARSIDSHTLVGIPFGRISGTDVELIRTNCAIRSSPDLRSCAAAPAMSA